MSKMSEMQMTIEDLRNAAATINDVADTLYKLFSGKATEEPKEKQISLEEVRAVLAEKSRLGFATDIRNLLKKYGADKLSGIAPKNYNALLKDAEVLESAT